MLVVPSAVSVLVGMNLERVQRKRGMSGVRLVMISDPILVHILTLPVAQLPCSVLYRYIFTLFVTFTGNIQGLPCCYW